MSNLDNAVEEAVLAVLNTGRIDRAKTALLQTLRDHGFSVYATRATARGRAPRTSTPMTPALAKRVRAYKRRYPKAAQSVIAAQFNLNAGRVSEALRGLH